MSFIANARRIPVSPYKMRPLVDVIRGKNVKVALNWLDTCAIKRAIPIRKMVASAAANAKHLSNVDLENLFIKEIRVDQGTISKYFKPGAQGRSTILRKRFCHMSVTLEPTEKKAN